MSPRDAPPPSASDPLTAEAARFAADLARAGGGAAGGRVLLAVSGGPDSMAMLALAATALPGRITAATVDHGLRPDAADEAAMVARWCAGAGVPHHVLRPVEAIAGASIQAAARQARYALLAAEARRTGAGCVLTAHHADDQAETFLMRAARGSGLAGLAGVRPLTMLEGVAVARPLLEWRRAELHAIVKREGVPFVDDPSNADPAFDRTRFRRLLDANGWLDPSALARSAAILAETDADLRAMGRWLWDTRARATADGIDLDIDGLPREARRRLVRHAIGAVRDAAAIDTPAWSESANVEALLDALEGGRRATQAGVMASPRGSIWRFRPAPPRRTG